MLPQFSTMDVRALQLRPSQVFLLVGTGGGALAKLPVRQWASSHFGELGALSVYATMCSALSVIVFAVCQSIDGLFSQGSAMNTSHGEFADLLSSAAGHTFLMAAAILGFILGGVVYLLEIRKSHRPGHPKESR